MPFWVSIKFVYNFTVFIIGWRVGLKDRKDLSYVKMTCPRNGRRAPELLDSPSSVVFPSSRSADNSFGFSSPACRFRLQATARHTSAQSSTLPGSAHRHCGLHKITTIFWSIKYLWWWVYIVKSTKCILTTPSLTLRASPSPPSDSTFAF